MCRVHVFFLFHSINSNSKVIQFKSYRIKSIPFFQIIMFFRFVFPRSLWFNPPSQRLLMGMDGAQYQELLEPPMDYKHHHHHSTTVPIPHYPYQSTTVPGATAATDGLQSSSSQYHSTCTTVPKSSSSVIIHHSTTVPQYHNHHHHSTTVPPSIVASK